MVNAMRLLLTANVNYFMHETHDLFTGSIRKSLCKSYRSQESEPMNHPGRLNHLLTALLRRDCATVRTNKPFLVYFRGMNLDECVAPMPGFPCLTGLYEIENSAK